MEDAKQEVVEVEEKSSSDVVDEALNAFDEQQETQSESSTEEKPQETEATETKEPSAEDEKTESSEEKEEEVPKEFHKHPAWQRIMKERDEAREAATKFESSDFESKLEQFNKVTSSPAYLKASMQAEGYTQEAINARLKEAGYQVEEPTQDDVKLVLKELNINPETLTQEARDYVNTNVADMAKVADIIMRDRFQKMLPQELQGLKEQLGEITQSTTGAKIVSEMKSIVANDGVLDFSKDVEPALQKFMDDNKEATQQDVLNYFKEINHGLVIERLRTQGKKEARDEAKSKSRPNQQTQTLEPGQMPQRKEGQAVGDYLDDLMDSMGINT